MQIHRRAVVVYLMLFSLTVNTSAKINDVAVNEANEDNINKPLDINEKIAATNLSQTKLKRDETIKQNDGVDVLFKNINNKPKVVEENREAKHEHSDAKEQDQVSRNSDLYSETTPYDDDAMLLLLETFLEPYTTNLDDIQGDLFQVKYCAGNQIRNNGTGLCEDPPRSPDEDSNDEDSIE